MALFDDLLKTFQTVFLGKKKKTQKRKRTRGPAKGKTGIKRKIPSKTAKRPRPPQKKKSTTKIKKKSAKTPKSVVKKVKPSEIKKPSKRPSKALQTKKKGAAKTKVIKKAGVSRIKSVAGRAKVKKKSVVKSKSPQVKKRVKSEGLCVGEITHFFSKIMVVVVKVTNGKLLIGDKVKIMGKGPGFSQKIQSMQVESLDVKIAKKGQLVGLKVSKVPKIGDKIYKIL